ncbi:hypothetical protein E2P64_00225 [Candidatus Bathyarchaeota archaeon]|nr:hypothetical protein E2P64_00225 [Candidatus Bathyarchaeota archaeon]
MSSAAAATPISATLQATARLRARHKPATAGPLAGCPISPAPTEYAARAAITLRTGPAACPATAVVSLTPYVHRRNGAPMPPHTRTLAYPGHATTCGLVDKPAGKTGCAPPGTVRPNPSAETIRTAVLQYSR